MIINTNQPHPTKTHNGLTRQEREERAAAAARHRQLDALRARVRASMAGMDETPADPAAYRQAGLQADATWEDVERRAPTGNRTLVKGRILSGRGGNKHTYGPQKAQKDLPDLPHTTIDDRSVAGVLRTIAAIKNKGDRLTVVYHDGESETLAQARPFLVEIISTELKRKVTAGEVNAAAYYIATTGSQLVVTGH